MLNNGGTQLRSEDWGMLVQTLIYDGRVELDLRALEDDEKYRPARLPIPEASAFAAIPCGVCPVRPFYCATAS